MRRCSWPGGVVRQRVQRLVLALRHLLRHVAHRLVGVRVVGGRLAHLLDAAALLVDDVLQPLVDVVHEGAEVVAAELLLAALRRRSMRSRMPCGALAVRAAAAPRISRRSRARRRSPSSSRSRESRSRRSSGSSGVDGLGAVPLGVAKEHAREL